MGYAELIARVQTLPAARQAEVFDFVEFLASREAATTPITPTLAQTPLAHWINHPVVTPGFKPFSREEANAR